MPPYHNLGKSQTSFQFIYALLFFTTLILGLWTGFSLRALNPLRNIRNALSDNELRQAPVGEQRNLLVIGVDSLLSSAPRLESIWLIAYLPGYSKISLIPILPPIQELASSERSRLPESDFLDASGAPSSTLVDYLQEQRLWWNGYTLLDRTALTAVLELLGGLRINGRIMDGAFALDALPLASQDEPDALESQTALLQAICSRANEIALSVDPSQGLHLAEGHWKSDFDLVREWISLTGEQSHLECEFPLSNPSILSEAP